MVSSCPGTSDRNYSAAAREAQLAKWPMMAYKAVMEDWHNQTAATLAAAVSGGRVSCMELLNHFLERVAQLNGPLNAVVTVDADGARARARDADAAIARGDPVGPLHGVPMTVKDSLEVRGMRCVSGSEALADHIPERSADAVERLERAGAIIFGKTNVPLYCGDFQTFNPVFGTTNNPHDTTRTPGGSSGGAAAALAAGMTPLEVGSDIGGSIRLPAHLCGVYGHKPSVGIVPRRGHIPPHPGMMESDGYSVIGPLSRSAGDLRLALDALTGAEQADGIGWRLSLPEARARRAKDLRAGVWLDDSFCRVDGESARLLEKAVQLLEKAGARVDWDAAPEIDLAENNRIHRMLMAAEIGAWLPEKVYARMAEAGDDGIAQTYRQWSGWREQRARLRERWREFFEAHDVLLCPVAPTTAFPHDHGADILARRLNIGGEARDYMDLTVWAGLAQVSGLPATVAPVGKTRKGLPVGIQIIGPYLEDYTPLETAGFLEGAERG